jgi:hypothetical protein
VSLCLTRDELVDLTDCKHSRAQARVCAEWGLEHRVDATGRVRITWGALYRHFGGGVKLTRLYLIRAAGSPSYLKIGISTDPERRVRSLQTGNPATLALLAHKLGCKQKELYLHRKFASYRANGEWFIDNPLIREEFGL